MAPKPTTKCSSSKLFDFVQQWLWQSGPKHSDFHRPRATVQIRTDIDKFERHNYFLPLRQPTLIVCIISVFHNHKTYVAHQVICLAFREHATPTIFSWQTSSTTWKGFADACRLSTPTPQTGFFLENNSNTNEQLFWPWQIKVFHSSSSLSDLNKATFLWFALMQNICN